MKRLVGIIIVAATIGTPAFAQNYRSGYWTAGSTYPAPSRAYSRTIHRHVGGPIYAMSPRGNFYGGYPYNDNTGGGSPGYNEMLLNW
jgi:hypothetical protein